MPQPQQHDDGPAAADVAAFLRANPSWLADNPELYRVLTPPARVHGDALADHMTAMLRAERAHAASMAERAADVLAAGRAAAGLTERVQRAVLALLRAEDKLDCISQEMPGLLGIDSVTLCVEAATPPGGEERLRVLPAGLIGRLLGGRQVVFRSGAHEPHLLHGEAAGLAGQDVLIAVPGHGPVGAVSTLGVVAGTDAGPARSGPPALLALLARDPRALEPGQGASPLAFLGQAVAASFGR